MLDGKILAAVLATLAALAVTSPGAEVQDKELMNGEGLNLDMVSILEDPAKGIRDVLTSPPEPEEQVEADLVAENLWDESFEIKNAVLEPGNITSISLGGKQISSDGPVTLYGFSGTVKPSNKTVITGSVNGVLTSGVNITESSRVKLEVSTEKVEIRQARLDSITLSGVTGSIKSGSASTRFSNSSRNLEISGFHGDITLLPLNRTVKLDGKVGKLEAGSFSFGN